MGSHGFGTVVTIRGIENWSTAQRVNGVMTLCRSFAPSIGKCRIRLTVSPKTDRTAEASTLWY